MSYNKKANQLDTNTVVRLASVTGIDLMATGLTNVYTVPTGKKLIPTMAVVRITALDTVLVAGVFSVGGNDADYNDIGSCSAGFAVVGDFLDVCTDIKIGLKNIISAGSTVKVNVTIGVTATTCTASVDLFGYLV